MAAAILVDSVQHETAEGLDEQVDDRHSVSHVREDTQQLSFFSKCSSDFEMSMLAGSERFCAYHEKNASGNTSSFYVEGYARQNLYVSPRPAKKTNRCKTVILNHWLLHVFFCPQHVTQVLFLKSLTTACVRIMADGNENAQENDVEQYADDVHHQELQEKRGISVTKRQPVTRRPRLVFLPKAKSTVQFILICRREGGRRQMNQIVAEANQSIWLLSPCK